MGFLKGYENIAWAAKHNLELPSKEAMESFQIDVLNLLSEAYQIIKTSEKFSGKLDETQMSVSLFDACCIISDKNESNCWIAPEYHELTDEIRSGKKKAITAKRFDIYFGNWSTSKRVEYGIEAKLLVENDFMGRKSKKLIEEYVGDAGMNKYVSGIYKKRGCMVGYIVEGNISNIVDKINVHIESVFDSSQKLLKEEEITFNHKEVYKSSHRELHFSLFHLMLDFN